MVPPDPLPLSMVFKSDTSLSVGPGGGYGWGGGPRRFIGGSRPPESVVEVGRDGDFPEGDPNWGPAAGDKGFPYGTRWPGWVSSWEPPFFDTRSGSSVGGFPGRFLGGALLEGRVSTVFACTDLISRLLASMGLEVTRGDELVESPPWTENPEPILYTSIVDAMQQLVNSLLHRGEAFLIPTARYADTMVARWAVLNPDYVKVEATSGGLPEYSVGGLVIERPNILHIRYQCWPGNVHGVGPLEACWRNILSADAMERWGTELALTNGIPIAVLKSEVKLTKVQADEIKRSWAESILSRGTLPAVLSGGLSYEPLNLRPADVGLLDLRSFDEQRIASTFGVPLWLVGLPVNDGLTYSTVDDTFDFFWRSTLRPLAYNIGQAMSGWALVRGTSLRFKSEQLIEHPVTAIRSQIPPIPNQAPAVEAAPANEGD